MKRARPAGRRAVRTALLGAATGVLLLPGLVAGQPAAAGTPAPTDRATAAAAAAAAGCSISLSVSRPTKVNGRIRTTATFRVSAGCEIPFQRRSRTEVRRWYGWSGTTKYGTIPPGGNATIVSSVACRRGTYTYRGFAEMISESSGLDPRAAQSISPTRRFTC
jgi:hypothetical protein